MNSKEAKANLDEVAKRLQDLRDQYDAATSEEEKTKIAFKCIVPQMNYRSAYGRWFIISMCEAFNESSKLESR
jgi:hypothetical protein